MGTKYRCQKCGQRDYRLFDDHYRCPNCHKVYHNNCLDESGIGIIRRGFCPNCGTEINDPDCCLD